MIAVKYYGSNDLGVPEGWPKTCIEGIESLPDGFDRLFNTVHDYDVYRNNLNYSPPEIVNKVVPEKVEAWKARYILNQTGWDIKIKDFINGLPEPKKSILAAAWNFNSDFKRSELLGIAPYIEGMTGDTVDDLMIEADKLNLDIF